MKLVLVDDLAVGEVLATDVVSDSGQILCKKGLTVNEAHIRFIKNFGIKAVSVQGESFDMASVAPDILQAAKALVEQRFKHNAESHPLVEQIKQQALIRTAQSLTQATA